MSTKSFDPTKFRNSLTKSITGMSSGFNDPSIWISTGSYALNYLVSGDFHKGIPLGKVSVLAGESGCLPSDSWVMASVDGDAYQQKSVEDLREAWHSGSEIWIDSPDGMVKVVNWFDKGKLPMYRISTKHCSTRCAANHLLQRGGHQWVPAEKVKVGAKLQTIHGVEEVLRVEDLGTEEECYDFEVDHDKHRYWGDGFSSHNSGKSYIASGNIVKNAQEQGIFVVMIDSENALDEAWLKKLGVDTSEEKLLKLNMAMIDDVAKTISEFMKNIKTLDDDERPQVLFVIDSLGMLMTPTETNQFEGGDMKGDMGRKAKALKALVTNCVNMFGAYNIGLVATNHSYQSQDMFKPGQVVSGGSGFIFASSVVITMQKLTLKEDEDGNKVSDVRGIRSACKVEKSRYSKPFEAVKINIPWDGGMDPYSGLTDLFEKKGLLTKSGNKLIYTTLDGEEIKKFRKQWNRNDDGCLDIVMREFEEKLKPIEKAAIEAEENDEDELNTSDDSSDTEE